MLNTNISGCGAVILAAGESLRMGKPKWQLEYSTGKTFLIHLIEKYHQAGISEIVVVINNKDFEQYQDFFKPLKSRVKVVVNHHPVKGRLYSIQLGIKALSDVKFCFIHNIDNPFLENSLLNQLFDNLCDSAYIKPDFGGKGGHPLLVSEEIVRVIRKNAVVFEDFRQLLCSFEGKRLEVEFKEVLFNINSPEDYQSYLVGARKPT